MDLSFYQGKKVLITGHTGFKGSWMCKVLLMYGAKITGYALKPSTTPSIFEICGLNNEIHSVEGDIRDFEHLKLVFQEFQPEIVVHMAAQPIVRESYRNPVYTYDVNVMGTVNILECIRVTECVRSFINVTTDKVYFNREWIWGYRENEELNGFDPYSNSKSCSELVTDSYKNSFFLERNIGISTVRAGNVIGGGDYSLDRIIPDCIRAARNNEIIKIRNPYSIRPYQHVLEPITVYLMVAQEQFNNKKLAGSYNVGPDESDCRTTGELVSLFCDTWKKFTGCSINYKIVNEVSVHEASCLRLDCSKLKNTFGWRPTWKLQIAIEKIVEMSLNDEDMNDFIDKQIREFFSEK